MSLVISYNNIGHAAYQVICHSPGTHRQLQLIIPLILPQCICNIWWKPCGNNCVQNVNTYIWFVFSWQCDKNHTLSYFIPMGHWFPIDCPRSAQISGHICYCTTLSLLKNEPRYPPGSGSWPALPVVSAEARLICHLGQAEWADCH